MQQSIDLYRSYTLENFLEDNDFVQWVKYPHLEKVEYWNDIIPILDDKKDMIAQARDYILVLSTPKLYDSEESRHRVWQRIETNIRNEFTIGSDRKPKGKVLTLWLKVASAAAIVGLIVLFLFQTKSDQQIANVLPIRPGKPGATLAIGNGSVFHFSEHIVGQNIVFNGFSIHQIAKDQISYSSNAPIDSLKKYNFTNTLATSAGQIYSIELPDKSKVWLNASSRLTYSPTNILLGQREVHLEGEGYFEIAKDAKHPFRVLTKDQTIEVLGTHFNVNAYPDEQETKTSLLEGSIRITAGAISKKLQPGDQAQNLNGNIQITQTEVANDIDWKEGDFYFNHINFKTAMRKISRWYDVNIIYESSITDDIQSGGWIARNKELSTVLKSIEASGLAKFRVVGRNIYVSK